MASICDCVATLTSSFPNFEAEAIANRDIFLKYGSLLLCDGFSSPSPPNPKQLRVFLDYAGALLSLLDTANVNLSSHDLDCLYIVMLARLEQFSLPQIKKRLTTLCERHVNLCNLDVLITHTIVQSLGKGARYQIRQVFTRYSIIRLATVIAFFARQQGLILDFPESVFLTISSNYRPSCLLSEIFTFSEGGLSQTYPALRAMNPKAVIQTSLTAILLISSPATQQRVLPSLRKALSLADYRTVLSQAEIRLTSTGAVDLGVPSMANQGRAQAQLQGSQSAPIPSKAVSHHSGDAPRPTMSLEGPTDETPPAEPGGTSYAPYIQGSVESQGEAEAQAVSAATSSSTQPSSDYTMDFNFIRQKFTRLVSELSSSGSAPEFSPAGQEQRRFSQPIGRDAVERGGSAAGGAGHAAFPNSSPSTSPNAPPKTPRLVDIERQVEKLLFSRDSATGPPTLSRMGGFGASGPANIEQAKAALATFLPRFGAITSAPVLDTPRLRACLALLCAVLHSLRAVLSNPTALVTPMERELFFSTEALGTIAVVAPATRACVLSSSPDADAEMKESILGHYLMLLDLLCAPQTLFCMQDIDLKAILMETFVYASLMKSDRGFMGLVSHFLHNILRACPLTRLTNSLLSILTFTGVSRVIGKSYLEFFTPALRGCGSQPVHHSLAVLFVPASSSPDASSTGLCDDVTSLAVRCLDKLRPCILRQAQRERAARVKVATEIYRQSNITTDPTSRRSSGEINWRLVDDKYPDFAGVVGQEQKKAQSDAEGAEAVNRTERRSSRAPAFAQPSLDLERVMFCIHLFLLRQRDTVKLSAGLPHTPEVFAITELVRSLRDVCGDAIYLFLQQVPRTKYSTLRKMLEEE